MAKSIALRMKETLLCQKKKNSISNFFVCVNDVFSELGQTEILIGNDLLFEQGYTPTQTFGYQSNLVTVL